MVSIGPGSGRAMFRLRLLTLMLGCALALAAASTIFKVFAVQEEFWPTIFWTFVGEAAVGAILLMTPGCRCRLASSFEANAGAVLAINGANELINLGGGLGARYALLFAPVGLVQAIAGTTSIFVFLFGGLLTVLAPRLGGEDLSPRNLVGKSAAVAVVALGVALTGASA